MSQDDYTRLGKMRNILRSTLVEELNLSRRAKNALIRAKINTALELQLQIEQDVLLTTYQVGPKLYQEIEDAMTLLFRSIGVNPKEFKLKDAVWNTPASEEVIIPDKYFDELPIEVLAVEVGDDLTDRLRLAGFVTVGELIDVAKTVLDFRTRNTVSSLERLIDHQKEVLQVQIVGKSLHPKANYGGVALEDWLALSPKESKQQLAFLDSLAKANEAISLTASLTEELTSLLDKTKLSERQLEVFLGYFGDNLTLEKIGQEIGVTRERVRQIALLVSTRLWKQVNSKPSLYLQSSLLWANDLGDELSLHSWKELLHNRAIISAEKIVKNWDSFDVLCALLRSGEKARYPPEIEISKNLDFILKNPSDLSLGLIRAIETVAQQSKRQVRRRISYVGGIHVDEAAEILNVTPQQASHILEYMRCKEVIPGWFTIATNVSSSKWPILNAGLIMMEVCGPLEFDSFCDGLRRYISRFYDALAPAEVVRAQLEVLGFELEDGFVCWPETPDGNLAPSDKCFIQAVQKYGLVVTFQEVLVGLTQAPF